MIRFTLISFVVWTIMFLTTILRMYSPDALYSIPADELCGLAFLLAIPALLIASLLWSVMIHLNGTIQYETEVLPQGNSRRPHCRVVEIA